MPDRGQQPDSTWPAWDPDAGPDNPSDDVGEQQHQAYEHPTIRIPASALESALGAEPVESSDHSPGPTDTTVETHAFPRSRTPDAAAGRSGATQHQEDHRVPDEQETSPAQPQQSVSEAVSAPPDERKSSLRRSRGVLITAIAVVVCLATGVVLALPTVANRLALPWAPNAPESDPPDPVPVARELHGPSDSTPEPTSSGVNATLDDLASDPDLGTLTGSVVDPATDEVLWEQSGDRGRVPASTTKLLTAGAALLTLEHDMRLSTTVVEGAQPGTVVVVPGGDVTLSSLPADQDPAYSGAADLDSLVEQVEQATDGDVRQVQIDADLYTGDTTGPGWEPEDVPSTFAASVEPGMLDGGRSVPDDPESERVADPTGTLAQEFAERLGAETGPAPEVPPAEGAQTLGEVESAPLTDLIDEMLLTSDNVLSEALARQVALAEGAEPSFQGAAAATLDVLARYDFGVEDTTLVDGSGLSPRNEIPASMLTELLSVVADPNSSDPRTHDLRPLLNGLPVAAGSGTLAERYAADSASRGRGWVRAKTGTRDAAHTLAGVVLDSDDRLLVFALMSSGDDVEAARAALDDIATALHDCGCQ